MLGVITCKHVDEPYIAKTRYVMLPSCEDGIIPCSFVFDTCRRVTNKWTEMLYTARSIAARCKNSVILSDKRNHSHKGCQTFLRLSRIVTLALTFTWYSGWWIVSIYTVDLQNLVNDAGAVEQVWKHRIKDDRLAGWTHCKCIWRTWRKPCWVQWQMFYPTALVCKRYKVEPKYYCN